MTAKEPRPGSFFRLSTLIYEPSGVPRIAIGLQAPVLDTTAFGVPPDAAVMQEHTDRLAQRLHDLRAALPPPEQALLDALMEQASAGGELDWPADDGAPANP
jgi:hypothetical protein